MPKKIRDRLVFGVMLASTALLPCAGHAQTIESHNIPAAYQKGADRIEKLANSQVTILSAFTAAPGINGYAVLLTPGHSLIIYTTPDGSYIFFGGLFGPNGKNLSEQYAKVYLPASAQEDATGSDGLQNNADSGAQQESTIHLYDDALKLNGFSIGADNAPKNILMFIDPNCIYCKLTYDSLTPYIKSGELRVHIIPVGFLKTTSMDLAAEILEAKDPAQALSINEKGFDESEEQGGLPDDSSINQYALQKIQENTDFFKRNELGGTPFLIYPDEAGKFQVMAGMPQSIPDFISEVKSK